jgi:hypothetical protein
LFNNQISFLIIFFRGTGFLKKWAQSIARQRFGGIQAGELALQ